MIAEGWQLEVENGNNYASCEWRTPYFKALTVEFAGDALTVDTEVGSGYGRESTSATIPLSVLRALLKGAGYVVSAAPVSSAGDKP